MNLVESFVEFDYHKLNKNQEENIAIILTNILQIVILNCRKC